MPELTLTIFDASSASFFDGGKLRRLCSELSASFESSMMDDDVQLFDMDATVVVVDDVGAFFCGSMTSKSSSKMLDERTLRTMSEPVSSFFSGCGASR